MKRFLKRVTAILLCLVLSCSLLPITGLAASSHPFRDVPDSHWANSAVAYVYDNNLMNGTGPNTFTPSGTLTRAMFVTILGRMDGVNTASYPGTSFSDVPTGQWYSPYVAWASSQGIVTGTGNGQFSPNSPVTREQMAAMIARYVEASGIRLPDADNAASSFKDAASVSSWARDGLELMRRTGILSGYSDGTFGPKKTATRAEAATIFMRLCVLLDGGASEEPSDEGLVYQEDTIVLDGSVKHSESGNTVTFSKSSELQNLKKGDIIVVGTESAYKVVDSSVDGNSIQVTYTTPELYEFLESIDVEGEAQMDFSQFVPADGVTVSYNSSSSESQIIANLPRAFEGVADTGINVELKASIPMDQGREIEFTLKEAIPSLSYKFDMDFNPSAAFIPNKSVLYINEAYVKIKEELSLSVGLKTNIDSTEKFVKTFKVGTVPAVGKDGIGIVIDLYIALTTEGTFEVQYTLNGLVGCQIKDNKPGAISELKSTQDLSLMGAVKLGPKVSVVADLFDKKLLSFSVDAGARAAGEVIVRGSGMTCFEGNANMYLELTAFDDDLIEKYLHLSETWEIWDENSSPIKEKLHFEMLAGNLKKVDECTYKAASTEEKVVTGKVVDSETNQPLSGVKVYLDCIFGEGGEDVGDTYTTGADGSFSLEVPNNATDVTGVRFEKDGYKEGSYLLTGTPVASCNIGTYQMTPAANREVPLVNCIGMSVNQVSSLYGNDFTYVPEWFLGNLKGIIYQDLRVPAIFYFEDDFYIGTSNGSDRIVAIEVLENAPTTCAVTNQVSSKTTYTQIKNLGLSGVFEEGPNGEVNSGFGESAVFWHHDSSGNSFKFAWCDGANPNTTNAWIMIFSSKYGFGPF